MAEPEIIDLCDSDDDTVPPLRKATPTKHMASRSTSAPSPNHAKKQTAKVHGGANGSRSSTAALSRSFREIPETLGTKAAGLLRAQARNSSPPTSSSMSKKRPQDDAENPREYTRSPKRFKLTQAPNSNHRNSMPKETDRPASTSKGPHKQTAHAPSALMIDLTNEDTTSQSDEESTSGQQGIFIPEHRKRHPLHESSTTHTPRKRKATHRSPRSNLREQRAEIPESLPGSPEDSRDVPSVGLGSRDATPGSDRTSTVPTGGQVAPRFGSSADSCLLTKQRQLPLTPSESSADERISTKARGSDEQNSPARFTRAFPPLDSNKVTAARTQTKRSKVAAQTDGSGTTSRRDVRSNGISRISPLTEPQDIVGPRVYATLSKSTTDELRREFENARGVSRSPATAGNKLTVDQPIKTSEQVGRLVNRLLDELRQDTEHWTRASLRRARNMCQSQATKPPDEPTSVFSQMKPLVVSAANNMERLGKGQARFESQPARMNKKSTWVAAYTSFDEKDEDVPPYSNVVRIQRSFLANNESTLQHAPYFDDDFDDNTEMDTMDVLAEAYHVDVGQREEKLLDLSRAEHLAECAEEILKTAGCGWEDILRFLLEEKPDVGTALEAQEALKARDTMSDIAPFHDSERWGTLVSKLPAASPGRTGIAGLVCKHFQREARFSFWHVARRSQYTRDLLAEDAPGSSLDDLTCRVCMRFCCPYHGEIQDCAEQDGIHDVETDIINPPNVNNRLRVAFPETVHTEKADIPKERRTAQYWQPGGRNASLNIRPNDKGPFYPCHHPGLDCKTAECSCFVNRIPCEKTCACPPDCLRRFQGCNCTAGKGRVCFEDERCACWANGRECDPDLCGDCGVRDVLDPKHRHDDKILPGNCHLASIQRGVPKHTIIGKSDIHGFGLYACEVIRQHEFIGEYKGEVITKNEAERRGAIYEHQNLSYLFTLNTTQEVDSTFFGNKTRFMNHATKSNQNVYARIILVNTVHRIGLYAQRNIRPGEELCFGYGPLFKTVEDPERGKRATKAQTKSVPRVRNANITKSFWDPQLEEGERAGAKGLAKSRTGGARAGPSRARRAPLASSDDESDEYTAPENDDDDDEEDEEDLYS